MVRRRRIAQRLRLPMRAKVECELADAGGGAINGERLAQIAAEAVLEHERQPPPFFAEMKGDAIAVEDGHGGPSLTPSRCYWNAWVKPMIVCKGATSSSAMPCMTNAPEKLISFNHFL